MPVAAGPQLRASVVIPCYTEKRWGRLVAAVESALAQDPPPLEVVVSVDYNEALYERARKELRGVKVVRNAFTRGVSGGRNTGVQSTGSALVVMLDDDATMRAGTLAGLLEPFRDAAVVGAGSAISPNWERNRPRWFPDEFLWVVTASYTGMPTQTAPVRNVWGACMAVRRDCFAAVGGFRVDFSRISDVARPEDTDLCLRMSKASGGRWMYVTEAVIDHPVPAYRASFRYFLSRCYHEGRGKVAIARINDGRDSLESERDYLRRTLPRGVVRGLRDTVRGRDLAGVARAFAIVAGTVAAAIGGAVETVAGRRGREVLGAPVPVGSGE